MFILYDLIFLIFALVYLPIYLFKGKFNRGFLNRLGILPRNLDLDKPIWIHAVSLGEAISVRGLAEELRKVYPNKKLVISTVTSTGNKIAKTICRSGDLVIYLPLDFSFTVRMAINKINPSLFIIAETEIWPNLISYLYKKRVPIVTVNARISDNSFKGYSAIIFLIKPILNKISLFCAQTEVDAERLKQLGVGPDKIKVTGNLKFDRLVLFKASGSRQKLGLDPSEKLLVAGSTHSGEEEIILEAYKDLLKEFSGFKLLIAPRHPERTSEVGKVIIKKGFYPLRVSQLDLPSSVLRFPSPVFILDTVGSLMDFYAAADIVFVGGSLIKKGGHNILEPASLGKPVIFGPHMFNFRDIAGMFLNDNAAIKVETSKELEGSIRELLKDNSKASQLIKNASTVIARNKGATLKIIEAIKAGGVFNGN